MNKIALIPSYEPDEKLIELVKELKDNNYEIIIVDDGSGDNYKEIFNETKKYSKVISYETNKGKGYALKKGISYISNNYSNYIIITMDCDGQHTVKDANKLFEYNVNNLDILVLGKRLRDKKIPIRSKFGNAITRFIFKIVSKNDIYDTQTGLRSFSYELVPYMLSLEGDRYEYEMNMLLNLKNNNIKSKEITIKTIYFDNNKASHFNALKDSYLVYKQIIKYSLSSFSSFIVDYILYSLFLIILSNVTISNILSRIISATFNYNMNKKVVFKSSTKYKSAIEYFILAIIILLLNTVLLNLFVNVFNINAYISKIITEITLSILSYLVQKNIIFKKEVAR